MTPKKKYADFETALARLEEITDLLEEGEQSLEESIKFYTEGLEIAKFCSDRLSDAEKKIKLISGKDGETVEEDFSAGQGSDDAV
ncbi:MAG: exodeoxyribonuclease VII small subunit [Candidatus Zixiibacteriota bacterium]|nr:MAG: exodeoxyribonuclease VII small subunit [candidate division Zixibacteria bacterium]